MGDAYWHSRCAAVQDLSSTPELQETLVQFPPSPSGSGGLQRWIGTEVLGGQNLQERKAVRQAQNELWPHTLTLADSMSVGLRGGITSSGGEWRVEAFHFLPIHLL